MDTRRVKADRNDLNIGARMIVLRRGAALQKDAEGLV